MKKTFERLKKDNMQEIERYMKTIGNVIDDYNTLSEKQRKLFDLIYPRVYAVLRSSIRYIQTLEDYRHELDETWEGLLKASKENQKRVEKKTGKGKTSYIK